MTLDVAAGSSMPPHFPVAVSGAKTTGFPAAPLIWIAPLVTISAADPAVPLPEYSVTMVPAPMVRVAPAEMVRVPVTWMREFAGQVVLEEMVHWI